jgi:hypothetical protein
MEKATIAQKLYLSSRYLLLFTVDEKANNGAEPVSFDPGIYKFL